MARPKKQTVEYFPHDTNASEKKTLTILQSKFGNDGYAFWFRLLELLGKTPGHYIIYKNDDEWEYLIAKLHVSTDKANEILQTLMILGAIDQELYNEKCIWCQNFIDGLIDVYERRKTELPLKPSLCTHNVYNNPVNDNNNPVNDNTFAHHVNHNPQSKVKYSRVNKINEDVVDNLKNKLSSKNGLELKEVFARIDKIRGYRPSTKRAAEAKAISKMLKSNYTPDQIIQTWEKMKADKFWQDKELFMMTVESQIGAVLKSPPKNNNDLPTTEELEEAWKQ